MHEILSEICDQFIGTKHYELDGIAEQVFDLLVAHDYLCLDSDKSTIIRVIER